MSMMLFGSGVMEVVRQKINIERYISISYKLVCGFLTPHKLQSKLDAFLSLFICDKPSGMQCLKNA
jgi:hypothetical protein